MSEPVTTWRPLIEFDEDEQRIGALEAPRAGGARAPAAILHFTGAGGESGPQPESAFDDEAPAAEGWLILPPLHSSGQEPVIRGDFAEIEAALLGAARPGAADLAEAPLWPGFDLRASRADFNAPAAGFPLLSQPGADADGHQAHPLAALGDGAAYPADGASADNFMLFDDAAVSGGALADDDKRSRRPLFIMAALVLAGLAGITATSLRREASGEAAQEPAKPAALASLATEAEAPPPPAVETAAPAPAAAGQTSVEQIPVPPTASQQLRAQQPSPAGADAQASLTPLPAAQVDAAVAKAPAPAEIEAVNAASSILAPPPPGKAQMLAEPSVKAAMVEAKKVKTTAVRPDGTLIKAGAPAARTVSAEAKPAAAKPAPVREAASKDAAAKPAKAAAAKTPHAGAVASAASGPRAKPAQAANAGKPAAPEQAAQIAEPAATPAPTPAKTSTGPLAFVDTAVSSITGATGKLLDWGRTASSGAH